jgi:hypothetical protein
MGTRHLTAVVLNGEYKVAQYGQWDGYLTGQGIVIAKFLESLNKKKALDKFKKAVSNCKFITDEECHNKWKEVGADDSGLVSFDIADKFKVKYPALSRDTGAKVLEVILKNNGAELTNSIDFAGDSLFCEYAYVIDLDTNTLEIYSGFNTSAISKDERFASAPVDKDNKNKEYQPIKFMFAFDLQSVTVDDILELNESLSSDEGQDHLSLVD